MKIIASKIGSLSFNRNTSIEVFDPVFWPSTPAAPGCPEVPAVQQTVQVQSWPQLPHNG